MRAKVRRDAPAWTFSRVPGEGLAAIALAFLSALNPARILQKQNLALDPMTGEEVEALVRRLYSMPAATIERARDIVPPS